MSRLLSLFTLIILGCQSPLRPANASDADAPRPIRAQRLIIGVSAYYGANPTEALEPLVHYLSRELGIPVTLRVAETYVELPALLERGEIDIAQLAPLAYVQLRRRQPGLQPIATPIVGGTPSYVGHIYVRSESPVKTLDDLRGQSIAFVSRDSSSGYLYPRELLRRRGENPNAFFSEELFVESHPDAQEAVLTGKAVAGAAFDATSDWTGQEERPEGLRVIAKTERIPNDCIAARPGYDRGTVEAFRRALVALKPGVEEAESILGALKVNGWVPADATRYDRIEELFEKEALMSAPVGGAIR